mmetsp:Transcript_12610/g.23820  ORF Transcript_12610/g.23820 Transcript_12610/m.23820 type:complete len:292 (+) Transcript_12610:623-1498(+)
MCKLVVQIEKFDDLCQSSFIISFMADSQASPPSSWFKYSSIALFAASIRSSLVNTGTSSNTFGFINPTFSSATFLGTVATVLREVVDCKFTASNVVEGSNKLVEVPVAFAKARVGTELRSNIGSSSSFSFPPFHIAKDPAAPRAQKEKKSGEPGISFCPSAANAFANSDCLLGLIATVSVVADGDGSTKFFSSSSTGAVRSATNCSLPIVTASLYSGEEIFSSNSFREFSMLTLNLISPGAKFNAWHLFNGIPAIKHESRAGLPPSGNTKTISSPEYCVSRIDINWRSLTT